MIDFQFFRTFVVEIDNNVSVYSDGYRSTGVLNSSWGTTVKILKNFYDTDGKLS